MQRACVILCYRLWLFWLYQLFPHFLLKARFLKTKVTEQKMYVLSFAIILVRKSLIPSRIERNTFTDVYRYSYRVPFILVIFSFLNRFSENALISKFVKIRLIWSGVAPCGKTDMKKLTVACYKSANAPNYTCVHAGVGG